MQIKVPALPPRKKKSVFAETGDVTMFTSDDTICLTVKGLSAVDRAKDTVGASGFGRAFTYMKLPEAEAALAALTKAVEEIKWRTGK